MSTIAYKFQAPNGSYWYISADDHATLDYWKVRRKMIALSDDEARRTARDAGEIEEDSGESLLQEGYAEGRKDADEETVAMLRDELTHAVAMARGNAGNPRYDYYADCIRMLLSNFESSGA